MVTIAQGNGNVRGRIVNDSIIVGDDSLPALPIDTTIVPLDSVIDSQLLQLDSIKNQFDKEHGIEVKGNPRAIQWNDSVAAAEDSIRRRKKPDVLDAPVSYEAKDSVVFFMKTKNAYLYGEGDVRYQNMKLTAEQIQMNMDSSIVHATYKPDTLENKMIGKPVFKQGNDEYVSEKMDYNFKTRKGFITNVTTETDDGQGRGFIRSEESKKGDGYEVYLRRGTYTTCDEEHPHFYIAMSRAKVHTGKSVFSGPAWLVVEDVPLPVIVPFAFFPLTSKYSSGFIFYSKYSNSR